MILKQSFAEVFGRAPTADGSAPGRVNLIGEHTDYNGGAVLPAALPCRVHVAFAPNGTAITAIKSTRFDGKVERPVGDQKRGDWTDYAMGALRKAESLGWIAGGIDLLIESNVPDGAGVSSSAALITAILRAASETANAAVSAIDIAQIARAVENDYIGMPCGIMDQMAVGLAKPGTALALNTSNLSYDIIDIPKSWSFVTIHSGIRRELADGRYKARFEECRKASEQLGTETLCLLDQRQIRAINDLPDNLRKRARHVTSEHGRTVAASRAMRAADFETFATLMNESHRSYSRDFEASTPQIDALVEDAIKTGAKGARLTGGGFGGCIVLLIESGNERAWAESFLTRHPTTWRVS